MTLIQCFTPFGGSFVFNFSTQTSVIVLHRIIVQKNRSWLISTEIERKLTFFKVEFSLPFLQLNWSRRQSKCQRHLIWILNISDKN